MDITKRHYDFDGNYEMIIVKRYWHSKRGCVLRKNVRTWKWKCECKRN